MASGNIQRKSRLRVKHNFALCDPEQLTSPFFPSKVGGKPAWLDIRNLPAPDILACRVCGKPLVLPLQLNASIPERSCAFHRSLFVFMCKDPSCHQHQGSKAFRVLRCQLPRENDFYKRDTDHTDFVENQGSGNEGASTSNCQNSDSQGTKSGQTMCKEQSEIDGDTDICCTNQTTDITTDKDRLSTEKLGVAEETAESSNAVLDASSCSEKKVTTNLLAIEEVHTRRNLS